MHLRQFLITLGTALLVIATYRPALADLPVPDGLQPGDTYQLLFNSSTFTNALSSNIDIYNDFVQAAADAAGIGTSEGVAWKAIASTASIDARVNAVVGANTPVYNTRAAGIQKIADGFQDLWDGTIDQSPAYSEFGNVNEVDPWTGSTSFGQRSTGATLGNSNGSAWCGHPTAVDGDWLQYILPPTWAALPVYALSEELTVPDADFDSDQDIDGNDFLLWQQGAGDADGNDTSDSVDLVYWAEQYGNTTGGGLLGLNVHVIPEPSCVLLLAIGSASSWAVRRRRLA